PSTSPVIPSTPFGETLSFQDDPDNKVGRSYNIDVSIQREIKGGLIVDASFVGRYSRRLPHAVNFTQAPYMFMDPASGQTFAKAMDDGVLNQNQAAFYTNSFHPGVDYGPSAYDRTHVFNANYVYDLPAGRGHKLSGGRFLDRIIGGWYTSGVFTALSGVPLFVTESSQVWGDDAILGGATGMIPTASVSTSLNGGVVGSGGVGTAGGGA